MTEEEKKANMSIKCYTPGCGNHPWDDNGGYFIIVKNHPVVKEIFMCKKCLEFILEGRPKDSRVELNAIQIQVSAKEELDDEI